MKVNKVAAKDLRKEIQECLTDGMSSILKVYSAQFPDAHHCIGTFIALATVNALKDMVSGLQLAVKYGDVSDITTLPNDAVVDATERSCQLLLPCFQEIVELGKHLVEEYEKAKAKYDKEFDSDGKTFDNLFSRLMKGDSN